VQNVLETDREAYTNTTKVAQADWARAVRAVEEAKHAAELASGTLPG
jgi:hypothetical protein